MSLANYQITEAAQANPSIFRSQINAIFADILAHQTGIGSALPASPEPEGRLFYRTSNSKLYIAHSNAWVQVT